MDFATLAWDHAEAFRRARLVACPAYDSPRIISHLARMIALTSPFVTRTCSPCRPVTTRIFFPGTSSLHPGRFSGTSLLCLASLRLIFFFCSQRGFVDDPVPGLCGCLRRTLFP